MSTPGDGAPTSASITDLSARRGRSNGAAPVEVDPAAASHAPDRKARLEEARRVLAAAIGQRLDPATCRQMSRGELARLIGEAAASYLSEKAIKATLLEQRDLVTVLLNELLSRTAEAAAPRAADPFPTQEAPKPVQSGGPAMTPTLDVAKRRLQSLLMERMDVSAAAQLPRPELERQVAELIGELLAETKLHLNMSEQRDLVAALLDEMLGLGPLEPLLKDEGITDIMVNGPKQVYVERRGKLELSDVRFRDDAHVMNVATRIVSRIGRRIDESSPLCDARLADGSRVNIIIPPLAIDGPSISIRKFSKKSITLDTMVTTKNISPAMATVLKIASRCPSTS
jgi:pilus assembly protein CpaF